MKNNFSKKSKMIIFKETLKRMAEDKSRLLDCYRKENRDPPLFMIFNTSYLCVFLFRISHYFYLLKRYFLAQTFWFVNLRLTGANIHFGTEIEGGLFLNIPLGVNLCGRIGRNCTVAGDSAIIKSRSFEDVGAGPGLPVVGDNVFIRSGSIVHGPVIIGNNSCIGPRCLIETDLPDNSTVELTEPIKRIIENVTADGVDPTN